MNTDDQENLVLEIPSYTLVRKYERFNSTHVLEIGTGPEYAKIQLDDEGYKIFSAFSYPTTPKVVSEKLKIDLSKVLNAVKLFSSYNLIAKKHEVPQRYQRYQRHLQYYSLNELDPIITQDLLSNLSIGLIGVGGIGNWVALNLIGLGLKKIRLIDGDTIEETNLGRQILFSENDLGAKKIDVVERELLSRNSNTVIQKHDVFLTRENAEEAVADLDFIVLSADYPVYEVQNWTNEACIKKNVPFMNVGYSNGVGVLGPLVVPKETACLTCSSKGSVIHRRAIPNEHQNDLNLRRMFNLYQAPSFSCLNSYVSTIAAYEIIKFFTHLGKCFTLGHRLYVNPCDFTLKKKKYIRNNNCCTCSV